MPQILITGGAGFIGSHLAEHVLRTTDWNITIVDKLTYAADTKWLNAAASDPRVKFIQMDLAEPDYTALKDEKPTYVAHLAAETHVDNSVANPGPFVLSNIIGTYNLLDWARTDGKLEKFLYFSTDEVFGDAVETPFHEWSRYNCRNPYSATKAAGEELSLAWQNTYKLPIVVSHCSNVFGERQNAEKFIPILVDKISSGKTVTIHCNTKGESGDRTYIYAEDASKAIIDMLEKGDPRQKFNIPGKKMSNHEMATAVAHIMGKPLTCELRYPYVERPGWDFSYSISGQNLVALGWQLPSNAQFWEDLKKTVESYAL